MLLERLWQVLYWGLPLLGYFFPDAFLFLFPPESLTNLELVSQVGLVLFMFVIGMELDFSVLKNKINETLVISPCRYSCSVLFGCCILLLDLRGICLFVHLFYSLCSVYRYLDEYYRFSCSCSYHSGAKPHPRLPSVYFLLLRLPMMM